MAWPSALDMFTSQVDFHFRRNEGNRGSVDSNCFATEILGSEVENLSWVSAECSAHIASNECVENYLRRCRSVSGECEDGINLLTCVNKMLTLFDTKTLLSLDVNGVHLVYLNVSDLS